MCEQEMSKDNDQSEININRRRVTTNQRSVDGDDTGSDDDRMVICETQDDSSECSEQAPIFYHRIYNKQLIVALSVICSQLSPSIFTVLVSITSVAVLASNSTMYTNFTTR